MASEKNFESKIKKFLNDEGCWFVKFFANGFTQRGVPDLLCCVNGYFIAIEVKAENGVATDIQKWNVERIRFAGGMAFVLKPSQFESFKQLVYALKEQKRLEVPHLIDGNIFRRLYGLSEV